MPWDFRFTGKSACGGHVGGVEVGYRTCDVERKVDRVCEQG